MRSTWKGPFIDSLFLAKKRFYQNDKNKSFFKIKSSPINLRSRRSTILPFFEKFSFKIYNGNKYMWLNTKIHHIGYKFGDFVLTKKKCIFRRNKKSSKK